MQFEVLGPLRVHAGGVEITIGSGRERTLLAVLLLHANRTVTVDRLVGAIWAETPPPGARNQLQGCVSRLRKRLATTGLVIVTEPAGYRATASPGDIDLLEFRRLVGEARTAVVAGRQADAVAGYRAALDLWRGPALSGIDTGRVYAAVALDEERVQTQEECIDAELAAGGAGRLVPELTELVSRYPHRERLHRALMLALYRADRQADALGAYRHARTVLHDELGIEPGAELKRLHQAILNRDPDLDSPAAAAQVMTGGPPTPRELPADVAGFTGRTNVLKTLDGLLADNPHGNPAPVVISAIAGTAGVGKTALAVHWAHRVADRFPDGQLYLNLRGYAAAAPVRPIEALSALLRSLGTPPEQIPTDETQAAALYRTQLAGRRALVVLDNACSVDQVRPLLPGAPGCLVLVTSRDRLTGLVARDGATRLTLDVLTPEEAQALLSTLLGAERVEAEPIAVAELARACAHLPLALRIAAAHLAGTSGQSISKYTTDLTMGDRLDALQVEGDIESAVHAALDQSYKRMPIDVQRMFRLLGRVPGPDFTLAVAAATANTLHDVAARHLRQLAAAHLLEERTPGRYAFHDLLRLHARRLSILDCGDLDGPMVQGLARYYLESAFSAAKALNPNSPMLSLSETDLLVSTEHFDQPTAALRWLDGERLNLAAAATYAANNGPHALAWLLSDWLRGYFWHTRHTTEWKVVATSGYVAASCEGGVRERASALYGLATLHTANGNYTGAVSYCNEALTLALQTEWRRGQARIGSALGTIYQFLGQLEEAATCYAESIAVAEESDSSGTTTMINLGNAYTLMGRLRDGRDQLSRALVRCRLLKWRSGEAHASLLLGHSYHYLSQFNHAFRHLEAAFAMGREIENRITEAGALDGMAAVLRDIGRLSEAQERAEASLDVTVDLRVPQHQAEVLNTLGSIYLQLGATQLALRSHELAMSLAQETHEQSSRVTALLGIANTKLYLSDIDGAEEAIHKGFASAQEIGYSVLEGKALTCLAEINLNRRQHDEATDHAHRALDKHRNTGHRLGEAHALAVLARIADAAGQPVATRRLQRALALFEEIGAALPSNLPRFR